MVWSLVPLLLAGVGADPRYSYSYDIICMYSYVRIATVDFSLKKDTVAVATTNDS